MPEETGPYGVVLARGRVDERLVPKVGIEPTLGFPNQILSLARLTMHNTIQSNKTIKNNVMAI
ncbi:MAG: hypothetical protein EBT06_11315 [Gammaproteobacteria bacterium]|nr:hypothetical protein [Gammaproteobacteria bacterium]